MSGMARPDSWNNRFVPTLEVMEFVRAKIRSGFMIEMFMADAGGDHRAVILRFLDRCAEFVAMSKGA